MVTKTTTYTPGPWKYHLGRGANPRFHVQSEGGYQVASTTELVRHPQAFDENAMREANARLLASAPDLLAIVEMVSMFFEENTPVSRGALLTYGDNATATIGLAVRAVLRSVKGA